MPSARPTRTRPLEEPDVVLAARSVLRAEMRRVRIWIISLTASGVAAVATAVAGLQEASYYLGGGVVLLGATLAVLATRNTEAARARRVLDAWERVVDESLDVQVAPDPVANDPRWEQMRMELAALRASATEVPGADEVLTAFTERARDALSRRIHAGEAMELDLGAADGGQPHARIVEVRDATEEQVAGLVDLLGRARATAANDVSAAVALLAAD